MEDWEVMGMVMEWGDVTVDDMGTVEMRLNTGWTAMT
jgi:hypothetical protein